MKYVRREWAPAKRRVVDKYNDRRTPLTTQGRQFPVMFGPGITGTLIYIASNPGCRNPEIEDFFDATQATSNYRVRQLVRKGLVIGTRRLQLNPGIELHFELRMLLVRLAASYGIPKVNGATKLWRARRKNCVTIRNLPPSLFLSERRTGVLAVIAMLGEAYKVEIATALRCNPLRIQYSLWTLVAEGLINVRSWRTTAIYSLNRDFPAARELETLLRRWARRRSDLRTGVNSVRVRRHALAVRIRQRRTLAGLAGLDKVSVRGTAVCVARKAWRALSSRRTARKLRSVNHSSNGP